MAHQGPNTITASRDDGDTGIDPMPRLIRVLDCRRPARPGLCVALAGVGELAIRRGEAGASLPGVLEVDDPLVSSAHAVLARRLGAFVLRDSASKNGTLVNGVRQTSAVLEDGDVLELGRTFFVYRDDAVPLVEQGGDDPERPVLGELATMVPELRAGLLALARSAPSTLPIVLRGESGVGKELAARAVHAASGRSGELVAVNCGALPEALVESELFGHRRGAFSGAHEDRPGLVRAADGGTLFLDEIGDLRPTSQTALLRVLQEREVVPIGGTRPIPVDVRVISATHRELDALVADGRFRRDLHARLAGFQLELPPIRDRREDLGLIVRALLPRLAGERAQAVTFHPSLVRAWLTYPFPGNVRELERCLAAALLLAGDEPVAVEHTPVWFRDALVAPPPLDLDEADRRRRDELAALLREHDGNVAAVARAMGKARMQVQRWMKRYALSRRPR